MRVVLVEDNPGMQKELARMVRAIPGAEVVLAADTAPQATQWLDSHSGEWDLAIVDMFLKQGHGFDVLRRCARQMPHQRAVMLSNFGRDGVHEYARAAGADRFFDKSHDMDALADYCRTMAAQG